MAKDTSPEAVLAALRPTSPDDPGPTEAEWIAAERAVEHRAWVFIRDLEPHLARTDPTTGHLLLGGAVSWHVECSRCGEIDRAFVSESEARDRVALHEEMQRFENAR